MSIIARFENKFSKTKISPSKIFPMMVSAIAISAVLVPNLSNAVPANAPLRAEAAVQKLNLTPKNKDFKFAKQEKKNGAVIFYNVKTPEGLTIEKMTVDNQEETGRVRITMEGIAVSEDEMSLNSDKFVMVFDELPSSNATSDLFNPNNLDKTDLNGDIAAENLVIDAGSMPIKLGKFSMNGLKAKDKNVKFDDFHVRDVDADFMVARVKMKEIDVAGINDALFNIINSSGKSLEKDWDNVGLDLFKISGVEVTSDMMGKNKDSGSSFDGLKLANFEISGLGKNVLKHFAINGFETGGTADKAPINIKIGEFSFDNLNLLYFKTIVQSFGGDKNQTIGDKTLADIAPFGPYGIVMTKARFADILLAVDGMKFTLDDMNYSPTFNAQNIVTAISMPKATFEASVTDKSRKTASEFSEFLSEFGLKSLRLSMAGDGVYDPVTGVVSNNNNVITAADIGELTAAGKMGGMNDFMKNTKLKDMADYSKSIEAEAAKDKNGKEDNKKLVEMQIKAMDKGLLLYKDLTIIDFNLNLKEFGFLNRLALSEAASKGKTAKAVRKDWAQSFVKQSKDKNNSPLEREFATSFGQFIEKGGSISFKFTPAQPVKVTRLFEKDATAKEAGLVMTVGN